MSENPKIIDFPGKPARSFAAAAGSRDWLSWDETEKTFGGIWEMETPCGRFFRVDLGKHRGLGFYAVGRIKSHVEADHKKAWKIAQQCRFRKVDSIHFPAPPVPSFENDPGDLPPIGG